MGVIFSFVQTRRPILPTDYQVQKSSLIDNVPEMIRLAVFEAKRDAPGRCFNGYQLEIVEDGAGVKHYNVTVYFHDDTPRAELDHRNLNGAEQAVFGQYLTLEDLARMGIGQKDTRA